MSLFRGLADDLELETWLNDYIFKTEAKYINPENNRLGTLISCAEMLLSGTTTICDGYFHEDIVAAVVNESGLNGIIAQGIIDFPAPGVPDPSLKIQNAIDYVSMIKNRYLNILPSIFCHSPYTCSTKTLMDAKKAAKLHKVINLDPNVADAVSIFKIATINGTNKPHLVPMYNPISHIVYSTT